jgi:uncharacterized RDD family membrane protein YckC
MNARTEELVYAGFGSRLGAFLIDLLITLVWAVPFRRLWRAAVPDPLVLGSVRASGLAVLAAFWVYLVVTTGTTGGTLGKHAVRLRVVTTGLERPDWLTVVFREVIGRVIVAATLGIGYLWIAVDPRKQGWHDRIADTLVLKRVTVAADTDPWSVSGRHRVTS